MSSLGMLVSIVLISMLSTCHSLLTTSGTLKLSDFSGIQPGNINKNIDSILDKFKTALPDRLELGDLDQNFASNCYLTGLKNGVYRHGDAFLEIPKTKAIYSVGLATYGLTVHCTWSHLFGFLMFTGGVKAHTNNVSIRTKITFEVAPGAHPMLEEFKVTYMDRIATKITGAGVFLNWMGEMFLNQKVYLFRDQIIRELEENVSKRLRSTLESFKLPSLPV